LHALPALYDRVNITNIIESSKKPDWQIAWQIISETQINNSFFVALALVLTSIYFGFIGLLFGKFSYMFLAWIFFITGLILFIISGWRMREMQLFLGGILTLLSNVFFILSLILYDLSEDLSLIFFICIPIVGIPGLLLLAISSRKIYKKFVIERKKILLRKFDELLGSESSSDE